MPGCPGRGALTPTRAAPRPPIVKPSEGEGSLSLVLKFDGSPQQGQSLHVKQGLSGHLHPQQFLNVTIPGLAEEE